MIPGVDLVGVVEASSSPEFKPGDAVVLNGWGLGETHLGAYAERVRVKSDWLIPLPAGLTPHQAMAIGTAGYTAMLCLMAIERHGLEPDAVPPSSQARSAVSVRSRSCCSRKLAGMSSPRREGRKRVII